MKIILSFVLSLLSSMLYAGPIDWSVAMTSFPSDQSVGDTGQEKTPNGYVDLMSGNLVYDVPEVTLKGERGLNFTLSRSYGKVNNGFRSMGNWELESPRLVMMTGPSTKLQGDSGAGICEANGDATNNTSGRPSYSAALLDTSFKNVLEKSYINQVSIDASIKILNSIISLTSVILSSSNTPTNVINDKNKAQAAKDALLNKVISEFQKNINFSMSEDQAFIQRMNHKQIVFNLYNNSVFTPIAYIEHIEYREPWFPNVVSYVELKGSNFDRYLEDKTIDNLKLTNSRGGPYSDGLVGNMVTNNILAYVYYNNIY